MNPDDDVGRRDVDHRRERAKLVNRWLALALAAATGTAGNEIGHERAQDALSQSTAQMLSHNRDREVDALRDTVNQRFGDIDHRLDRIEDWLRPSK